MAMRIGKKWNRLMNIERLDDRINPDATFGWEVVPPALAPAGTQPGLYFRIDGDTSGQEIADTVSVMNNAFLGTIDVAINTTSADDGVPLDYFLSISGGEIALAQQVFGAQFKGVHVVTYDGNDTVGALGLPWAMVIEGGAGNDNLTGGNVADVIDGGVGGPAGSPGNDTINGSAGSDRITGNDGNDSIIGGTGNDTVDAGTGNDIVNAGAGNDSVTAGDGNDNVDAGVGNDNVSGGNGNDTIVAGDGNDNVDAGDGNDSVTGGNGNDSILAGTGNDNVNGDAGNDSIFGGDGNDALTGGAGADSILGEAGNDAVNAGTDDVFLNGGSGTDSINLAVESQPTLSSSVVLSDQQDAGNGSNFESFVLAPAANVIFAPGTQDFSGTPPNYGGIGLNAGDTLDFRYAPSGQTIDMNNLPFGLAGAGITSVNGSSFNDFITGTPGNDQINGSGGDDVLSGGNGNDTMNGGIGNDVVVGDAGDDVLTGGLGNDAVLGGLGNDNLIIEWNNGNLNSNDTFLGQDGYDTFTFQGVPDADGNPGNGIQPSAANMATILAYMTAQNAAAKMDWNLGNAGPDNPTIQFI